MKRLTITTLRKCGLDPRKLKCFAAAYPKGLDIAKTNAGLVAQTRKLAAHGTQHLLSHMANNPTSDQLDVEQAATARARAIFHREAHATKAQTGEAEILAVLLLAMEDKLQLLDA